MSMRVGLTRESRHWSVRPLDDVNRSLPHKLLADPLDNALGPSQFLILQHVLARALRKDFEEHCTAEGWADVAAVFQHQGLPVIEFGAHGCHAGDLSEVLEFCATIVLNDFISSFIILVQSAPEFEAVPLEAVSKRDALLVQVHTEFLG